MAHILIVEARFYEHLNDLLLQGARAVIEAEGHTHEEIAALMGRTASFSKSQLARGTRRLRALLTSELPQAATSRPGVTHA